LFAGLLTGLLTGLGFTALGFAFVAAVFSNAGAGISAVVSSGSVGSLSRGFNIVPLISRDGFLLVKCESACAEFLDGAASRECARDSKGAVGEMEPPSGRFFFSRRNNQQLWIKSASGFLRRGFKPCANRFGSGHLDKRALPVLADFAEFTRPVADLNRFLAIISFTGDLHIAPLAGNPWVIITSSAQLWKKTCWSESSAPPKRRLACVE
jgi:hypothetical protein